MTTSIVRCSECGHQAQDHVREQWTGGHPPRTGPCCQGGCACRLNQPAVFARNEPVEVPTWPGYDTSTGKWARR